jgi:hypothetical protein
VELRTISTSSGIPRYVQSASGNRTIAQGAGTIVTGTGSGHGEQAFKLNATTGDTILVFLFTGGTGISFSMTDSASNSYTSAIALTNYGTTNTDYYTQTFVAKNITGGSILTVTATLTATTVTRDGYMYVVEYANADTTNPVQTSSIVTTATNNISLTTSGPNEKMIAGWWVSDGSLMPTNKDSNSAAIWQAQMSDLTAVATSSMTLANDRFCPTAGSYTMVVGNGAGDYAINAVALRPQGGP